MEVSRKGGHINLSPTISEAVLNAENVHTRHVSALWNGLSEADQPGLSLPVPIGPKADERSRERFERVTVVAREEFLTH
jgi:hypothetical protein